MVDGDSADRTGGLRTHSDLGFPTRAFATGGEFLAEASPYDWGCGLLDLGAGDGDGIGVLTSLAARHVVLSAVATSRRADISSVVCAFRCGVLDYLEKPVPAAELRQAVAGAITISKTAA